MEVIKMALDVMDLIAKVLGFIALYSIAIAVADWRRLKKNT